MRTAMVAIVTLAIVGLLSIGFARAEGSNKYEKHTSVHVAAGPSRATVSITCDNVDDPGPDWAIFGGGFWQSDITGAVLPNWRQLHQATLRAPIQDPDRDRIVGFQFNVVNGVGAGSADFIAYVICEK